MDRINFEPAGEGRYDRQKLITWWDQDLLQKAHVVVAGAGALGNEVLKLLALSGVGQITVIDFDIVKRSNLARTVLFRESDIDQPKVEVVEKRLHELNPEVKLHAIQGDLRLDIGLGELRRADLVFGCLDSVAARWSLNRRCMLAGVDWIDGGISDFHGLVTYYSPKNGACYECNFTPATLERFNRRYSCPYGLVSDLDEHKVPTTALTTSAIAAFQVQQAMLLLHKEPGGLQPGERLTVYFKPFQIIHDRLPYNPECLGHEQLPQDIPQLPITHEQTVREALQCARGLHPDIHSLELGCSLVTYFNCPNCQDKQPILRPREKVFQHQANCPRCGNIREPEMTHLISSNSDLAELRLKRVGIPAHEFVHFIGDQASYYLEIL
jgi:adenylyltransferase/sulfurtransferase